MSGGSLLLPNGKNKRLKPSKHVTEGTGSPLLPLGLLPVPNVSQGTIGDYHPPCFAFPESAFDSDSPLYFSRQSAEYATRKKTVVSLSAPDSAKRVGFAIHRYKSGELTGARFSCGLDSKVSLNPRSGSVVTQSLTQKARTKIRRAIQNAEHDFKCFLTVTFSPKHLQTWQCEDDGTVRHDFAKYKFKKFLHSIKVSCDRKSAVSGRESDLLAYVWVAELQKNGNVHYHVLLNQRPPIKWLTALWGQASNSIDVRSINNLNHASCYLRKYMEKEKSTIQGNRYGITQGLRASMTPEKTVVNGRELQKTVYSLVSEMTDTIQINGGRVLEHGFYIPTPCRSVAFRNKEGITRKTIAVNAGLSVYLLNQISELQNSLPF